MARDTVLLAVSGSIAAYKMLDLASRLSKRNIPQSVVMTASAAQLIHPSNFSAITHGPAGSKIDNPSRWSPYLKQPDMPHIELAERAALVLIAPASYNIIGKIAGGLADDLLSTVLAMLPQSIPRLYAPAMNGNMYNHPVCQENREKMKAHGWVELTPDSGILACKHEGIGKLAQLDDLEHAIHHALKIESSQSLRGKKIVVSAGGTREKIDPVRFIGNRSSGRMGCAMAQEAINRGAHVSLIVGHLEIEPPEGVHLIKALTAQDMLEKITSVHSSCDFLIMAAAVADYTIALEDQYKEKRKKDINSFTLKLNPTIDILMHLAKNKHKKIHIGFAAETQTHHNTLDKCHRKNLDMLIINDVSKNDIGFESEYNEVSILYPNGNTKNIDKNKKKTISRHLWDEIEKINK